MEYQRVFKKIHEVGFDEFYQAGSPSKYHPMNIVARSKNTNKQYWICHSFNEFYIAHRTLDNRNAGTVRIKCKSQTEIVNKLNDIQKEIESNKLITV